MDTKKVAKGINIIAPYYDFLAKLVFGENLLKAKLHFLTEISSAKSILIFGGGSGEILSYCKKINPNSSYCYIDVSSKMIALAKKKNTLHNINFIERNFTDIPDKKFDIIITFFVLDFFNTNELEKEVIPTLKSRLAEKGLWLFTDFNKSNTDKLLIKTLIRIQYLFFDLLCSLNMNNLPDFSTAFSTNNLAVKKSNKNKKFGIISEILVHQLPNIKIDKQT